MAEAAGEATISLASRPVSTGGFGAAGAGLAGAGGATLGAPAGSMLPTAEPTATVSPACCEMVSTPAAGAGTSTVSLSVSSSKRIWSAFTLAPVGTSHLAMRPSVTASPAAGTVTATGIGELLGSNCKTDRDDTDRKAG